MDEEMSSQREHKTWTVVPRSSVPRGKRVLPVRWVFKAKRDAKGCDESPITFLIGNTP